ncbi:MAG: AAA family ATPase [Deltaproteobacteria bacterium]|nr:AAA family ATPase [Deltaproteobacteria bacterium]
MLDEASLASSEQMRGLLRVASSLRLPRVVLVGDEKQLDAVEAGKPFAQLKSGGMETAVMDEILRQRDIELMEAVRAGLAGEVKTAFARLGDRVAQAEPDRIGYEAAERWLSLAPEQRETAGVIAPTRALRDRINDTIRERLISDGVISGPAREVGKLVPRGLTHAEMTRSENYEAGDTVIFNRRYKTLGVENGDRREVAGVDAGNRTVHLQDDLGNRVEWKPSRIAAAKGGVELFRSESLELRRGDKVRFTRNDPASGLTNGQVAAVESVGKDGFGFRLEDGSSMKLGEEDPQLRHLDRAWAATIHAFQGRTVDRIIAAMPSGNANLVNQKSLYVAISRARDRADLVTDDPKRLADQLERATGERVAALDAVAEQSALEAGKQGELTLETRDERSWEAGDGLDRGQEAEQIEVGELRTGHETAMKSPDLDEERTQESPDAGQLDQELADERSEERGPESESEQEKTQEPVQEPLDLDLGL